MNYREFRSRFRLIPFGKFSISGRGKSPFNQIYVGRKKERASFIELLTHQEQFGSFLVSGRRGSGKTSFVNYALSEYEQSSFHRFIRFARNSGVQDLFVALLICILISTLFVLISQLGSLLTQNAYLSLRGDYYVFSRLQWVWVPLILILVFCFGLVLYAIQGVRAAAYISAGWKGKLATCCITAIFIGSLFAFFVYAIHTETPTIGNAMPNIFKGFRGGLSACVLALFAIANINILLGGFKFKRKHIKHITYLQIFLSLMYIVIIFTNISKQNYNLGNFSNFAALYFLFVFASTMYVSNFLASVKNNIIKIYENHSLLDVIIIIGLIVTNLFMAIISFNSGKIKFSTIAIITIPMIIAIARSIWWLRVHKRNKATISPDTSDMNEADYFDQRIFANRPPVEMALIVKSSFILLLAVTLITPLISLAVVYFSTNVSVTDYVKLVPLFHLSKTDITPIALILTAMFFYEYEWISRSMRTERQDSSIAPLGRKDSHAQLHELWPERCFSPDNTTNSSGNNSNRPGWADNSDENTLNIDKTNNQKPWMRRRAIARKLEKASLPYLFYNSRVPVILTWINLGFDDLRHSRIIEAMLVQLRTQYRQKFTSLSSQIGLATMIATIILVLFFTKLLSSTLFHIGPVNLVNDQLIVENQVNSKPVYGATNYCGFFERNPETAPAVKNAICLLPYSDRLFEFLYSRVLDLSVDFEFVGSNSNLSTKADSTGQKVISVANKETAKETEAEKTARECVKDNCDKENETEKDKTVCSDVKESFFCSPSINDSILLQFVLDQNRGLPLIRTITKGNFLTGHNTLEAYHPRKDVSTEAGKELPTLRVYHFLLFSIVYLFLKFINRTLQVLPYQERAAEMTRLIALIRGRITYTKSDMPGTGWIQQILGFRRRDETVETTPDPRIVEQSFIDLLQRATNNDREGNWRFWTWMEAKPEIVFIFDEMDKQSGKIDAEISRSDEASTSVEENTRERQRSLQLHQLLSDMKRLISSNAARFIFIGGRLYHDEWLADQANRAPLLSSIFNGQIYLPSLLTDREHAFSGFNDRIAEFFVLLFRNANHRFQFWRKLRNLPMFFGISNFDEPTYIQSSLPYSGHSRRLAAMAYHVSLHIYNEDGDLYNFSGGSTPQLPPAEHKNKVLQLGEQETLEQLLNFLTYRSAGNPKKLKEMLQSLVFPSSKAFGLPRYRSDKQHHVRWHKLPSHHDVIVLDDRTIYRIQFVDVLYRHLTDHLESKMLERDDKVSMSLFYLMDFLLKFHNRGFSWTNLQRVDELSHIHRSPDLRSMMGVLVDVSSERFLHRVLNGVYSFRFRSDFAREIDYLSRVSKEEMAALNFTLDESQNLKGLYQQTLSTGQRENVDTISGLGELYEYDQEFEIARNYYRRAISVLDRGFRESTGSRFSPSGSKKKTSRKIKNPHNRFTVRDVEQPGEAEWLPLGFVQLTTENNDAAPLIKSNFTWAIARLRLMLQIGHTYEQERNYERALGSYMHSHRFSQAILRATIATVKATADPVNFLEQERTITGENYSILYQAGMAAAWIFEKDNQDLDDSIDHAEHAVGWLYSHNSILFQEDWRHLLKEDAQYAPDNSSMMLVAGDMHNRVGNLYFFKGKQSLRSIKNFETYIRPGNDEDHQKPDSNKNDPLNFGYLLQSHYHYSMSIWNIRNYLSLRHETSKYRLNILDYGGSGRQATLRADGPLPDFLYNSLSNTITDMSEAVLARTSIGALLNNFYKLSNPVLPKAFPCDSKENVKKAIAEFSCALEKSTKEFSRRLPKTEINGFTGKDELKDFKLFTEDGQNHSCNLFGENLKAGNAFLWLGDPGQWPSSKEEFAKKRTLTFDAYGGLVDDQKRLFAYLYFSTVAADNLKLGGYSVDAANEYLLQAETMISILWSMRQANCLHEKGTHSTRKLIEWMLEAGLTNPTIELNENSFDAAQCILGTLAARALKKAANLIQLSYRPSTSHSGQNHGDPSKIKEEIVREFRALIMSLGDIKIGGIASLTNITEEIADAIDFKNASKSLRGFNTLDWYLHKHLKYSELVNNGYNYIHNTPTFVTADKKFQILKRRYGKFLADNNPDATEQEMQDDYHMSQAWRDDPRLLSLGASLVLSLVGKEGTNNGKRENVAKYVYDGFLQDHGAGMFEAREHENNEWQNADTAKAYSGLFRLCERHRYPVLNRLNTIKRLLDAAVIHGTTVVEIPDDGSVDQNEIDVWKDSEHAAIIGRLCDELTATAGIYDSDMHFSPYQHGTSLALAYFYCVHNGYWALYDSETGNKGLDEKVRKFQVSSSSRDWAEKPSLSATLITRESLGELSLNLLRRSEQLFSMGSSYYESIERMQYLNDDFNDRSIHYNHAKRMMFAEMAHVLASSVHDELYGKTE